MTDYKPVQDALANGADPAMLCATCPWDRYCITPPTMTKAEVDAKMAEAKAEDDKRLEAAKAAGTDPGLPMGSLMTILAVGGRDTSGQFCPVFTLRLRSGKGRDLVDSVKSLMQGWDDQK